MIYDRVRSHSLILSALSPVFPISLKCFLFMILFDIFDVVSFLNNYKTFWPVRFANLKHFWKVFQEYEVFWRILFKVSNTFPNAFENLKHFDQYLLKSNAFWPMLFQVWNTLCFNPDELIGLKKQIFIS